MKNGEVLLSADRAESDDASCPQGQKDGISDKSEFAKGV